MKKIYLCLAVCYGFLFAADVYAANTSMNSVPQNYSLSDPTGTSQAATQNSGVLMNNTSMPTRSYNTIPAGTNTPSTPMIQTPGYEAPTYQDSNYITPTPYGAPAPTYPQTYPQAGQTNFAPASNADNQIYLAPMNPNLYPNNSPQSSVLSGSWQAAPNNMGTEHNAFSSEMDCQESPAGFRFTGQSSYEDCESSAPQDQELNDCYCLNVHYRPCYYYTTEVDYVPKYEYLRCCRFVPEYFNVTRCKEESENYPVMRCKYVEEPYYVTRCRIIKEPYNVTRCKMHSEAYYEPRFCYCEKYNQETGCCEPALHQYQQTCYKDVPEYYQEQCFRDVPQYYQITCCKKVPYYYQVTCCRKVPRYYNETCCRYVPQYYYMVQCKYCPQYKHKRQCKYIPQYYYKHTGSACTKADMVMADDCGVTQ